MADSVKATLIAITIQRLLLCSSQSVLFPLPLVGVLPDSHAVHEAGEGGVWGCKGPCPLRASAADVQRLHRFDECLSEPQRRPPGHQQHRECQVPTLTSHFQVLAL